MESFNMTKKISLILFIIIFYLPAFRITGQEYSSERTDSIFINALKDELHRNISKLEDKESGKPFFISYSLLNGEITESQATLGALIRSASEQISDWYIRLMMGDYKCNDENFRDLLEGQDDLYQIQVACPIEPDYWGVRKAFWWNTNNVFRSASKIYKRKLQAINECSIDSAFEKLPDYTKTNPVNIFITDSASRPDQHQVERMAKELSAVFRNIDRLKQSNVTVKVLKSTVYMINSEGSRIRMPLNCCMVNISLQVKNKDKISIGENLTYYAPVFSALPPIDKMKHDAGELAQYLIQLNDAEEVKEEYHGPVLLLYQAAAKSLLSGLFGKENPLVASRKPLVYNMKNNSITGETASIENKLNKRIISRDLTVTILPYLESYNGVVLMGNVRIDAEGVVPPGEIVLIENGILKNLLSNRVPTPGIRESNGHHRIALSSSGFTFQDAPSIVKVSSDHVSDYDKLVRQLRELADEKGLEYAYVIKPLIPDANESPFCFYRMDLNTGEEKLVKPMEIGTTDLNDLNKRISVSGQIYIYNTLFNSNVLYGNTRFNGVPVSIILPDALLLEELNIKRSLRSSYPDLSM
jgi:hypothetical protein